jgi:signal transduction histidine kinase
MNEANATASPRFTRRGRGSAGGSACCARCSAIARENDRLRGQLRTRRLELNRAGARVVEAADAERRRLERNLHDGAQQRLVSIALQLRLIALRSAPDSETSRMLAAAQEELTASLSELRELAHGLHPAVLGNHGLGAALQSLTARAPLPVELIVDVEQRPPAPVEVAAYYLVSEALTNVAKYANAQTVTVRVAREHGNLFVAVADDGIGGANPAAGSGLRGLADRVESLGGRLSVTSPPADGTTIRAAIPCGSPYSSSSIICSAA